MGEVIVSGDLVVGRTDGPIAERSTIVRFRDPRGKTILEVKTDAAVEVMDQEEVLFQIDAAGDVEV
jgi:hypothetical protein